MEIEERGGEERRGEKAPLSNWLILQGEPGDQGMKGDPGMKGADGDPVS